MPIVAVRSMGLGFESLLGFETADGRHRQSFVSPSYLAVLMRIANERFGVNAKRTARLQEAFREAISGPAPRRNPEGEEWEDPASRRERKRVEGLKRKAELQAQKEIANEAEIDIDP
jgi:tRNA wybutosine-synthesizing protein 3